MTNKTIADQAISFDQSAELIAESEVINRLDLGHSLLLRLRHPALGPIAVLNSAAGHCALMRL